MLTQSLKPPTPAFRLEQIARLTITSYLTQSSAFRFLLSRAKHDARLIIIRYDICSLLVSRSNVADLRDHFVDEYCHRRTADCRSDVYLPWIIGIYFTIS